MATGRRRGRAIIYIALILILLIVLYFALTQMNFFGAKPTQVRGGGSTPAAQAAAPTQAPSVESVVVTTQDVRRGQELRDDLLAVLTVTKGQYTAGTFFRDKKEVVGSRAKIDMKAHTPVTTEMVVPLGSNGDIPSFEIPVGKVAVALPMDKLTSVAYGLQKGDHVNVIVLLKLIDLDTNFQSKLPNKSGSVVAPGPAAEGAANTITATISDNGGTIGRIELDPTINNPVLAIPSEPQRPRLVSQTLIQDAMVLQMGTFSLEAGQPTPQAQPTPANRNQPEPTPVPVVPDVVTIVVDPQDAVSLNYLMLAGAKLSFALRSAGDTTLKDTEAATLQFILDQYRVPNPAKLPYGVEPVAPTPEPPTSTTVK